MIENPERWAPGYAEAGARNVTVHAEACADPRAVARDIRAAGRAGRAGAQARHPARAVPRRAARLRHAAGHDRRARLRRPVVHRRRAAQGAPGPRAGRHRAPDAARRGRRRHQRRHHRAGRRGRRRRVRRRVRGLRRRRPGEGHRRAARAGRRGDAAGERQPTAERARRWPGPASSAPRVLGTTSPNPPVGAVDPRRRRHAGGGGRDRRRPAVRTPRWPRWPQAGERARGGTAVVTLEPCAHTGRTGPCADALLAAGIARVVVAVPEPTELAGGGAERLRAAGVDVELGVEQAEAEAGALAAWLHRRPRAPALRRLEGRRHPRRAGRRRRRHQPLDHRRARRGPPSTGCAPRCDAVVVGSGTVLADDPQLTVRDADGGAAARQPLRVVVDRRGRLPADRPGARRRRAHATSAAPPDPAALLAELFDRDVRRVLLEGGPTLAAAFLRAGLVDEVVVHLAPTLLGAGPVPGRGPGNQHDRRRAVPRDRRRHPPGRGRADPPAPDPAHWGPAARGRRELRCSPASSKRWAPSSSARTGRRRRPAASGPQRVARGRGPRRLDRRQRRLPDRHR